MPWDDLKLALVIVREGSLAGAARALAVSHATVFRRLRALESSLGVKLFTRSNGVYQPTTAGEDMAAAAERMESEALGVARRMAGRDVQPVGTVRLTTTDTLFDRFIASMVVSCRRAYPKLKLEVVLSNEPQNLTRRYADMAIRPVMSPPDDLIAHRLGTIAMAIYAPRDWAGDDAVFTGEATDWIGLDDSVRFPAFSDWMKRQDLDRRCGLRVDSMLSMARAASLGAGLALLPCYLGDREPGLRRLAFKDDTPSTVLWLLIHPDLRRSARVRAVGQYIRTAFEAKQTQEALMGG